jgi:RNA polymerase sigma-70 factor (ECF subfamily)
MPTDSSGNPTMSEAFLRLFTREQFRIAGFVRSLVVDPVDAGDVLQETSLELWRSFHQYDSNRDFASWAFGVARHQVLKHYRTKRRDRLTFSESLLHDLADETAQILSNEQPRFLALRDCVSHLTNRQRELVRDFYANGSSAGEIAQKWERNVNAVYNSLREIRKQLQNCITMRLRER